VTARDTPPSFHLVLMSMHALSIKYDQNKVSIISHGSGPITELLARDSGHDHLVLVMISSIEVRLSWSQSHMNESTSVILAYLTEGSIGDQHYFMSRKLEFFCKNHIYHQPSRKVDSTPLILRHSSQ